MVSRVPRAANTLTRGLPLFLAATLLGLALLGTVPHRPAERVGSVALAVPRGPYLPGSRVRVAITGLFAPYRVSLLGPGSLDGLVYTVPNVTAPTTATLIAGAPGAAAIAELRLVPAPPLSQGLIAVASYDAGIVLHDSHTFAIVGYVPIGGAPGDVAFGRDGTIAAPDTDGDSLALARRSPWRIEAFPGVALGNEIADDPASGAFFVSDRDIAGYGGLTRVSAGGAVTRVRTGITSEGLAVDARRRVVYVGNVNDASVTAVDADTMTVRRRIASVPRTFGIALDERRRRLYVVSNTSASMHGGGGFVAAIDLSGKRERIAARSARLAFPLGVAYDAAGDRVFVTDEEANVVYVLDARTLRPLRAPLRTCDTPWRPHIDRATHRLFVPCTRANAVDVFDLRSLRRVAHAPFATGGFPLGIATWK